MTVTFDELNLDVMEETELREFANNATQRSIVTARKLFPERQPGFVNATRMLGHYAWNKLTAMNLRKQGHVDRALTYEKICDGIYGRLPQFAKW